MRVEQGLRHRRRGEAISLHEDGTLGVAQSMYNDVRTAPSGREAHGHRRGRGGDAVQWGPVALELG